MHIQPRIVNASIDIPSSSKYTARALILASLSKEDVLLQNVSLCEDSSLLMGALEDLGITFESKEDGVLVKGTLQGDEKHHDLYVGNSGTAMRFLCAIGALGYRDLTLQGNERMHERPLGDLVEALELLVDGRISCENTVEGQKCPPVHMNVKAFKGGRTHLGGEISSQFLSGLLMVAPFARTPVEISIVGELVSKSYVDMTLGIMHSFGVRAQHQNHKTFLVPNEQTYRCTRYSIEPDVTGAAYFFAAAAISGGSIRIRGIPPDTVQGDIRILDILEKMGCYVDRGVDTIEVKGPRQLLPAHVDMSMLPDSAQTIAVLASIACGTSVIKGIANLRIKETDRIAALETELNRIGIRTSSTTDSLTIHGGTPRGARIHTYDDHRMAMSFALLGLKTQGIIIEDPECVKKSFPTFFELLEKI